MHFLVKIKSLGTKYSKGQWRSQEGLVTLRKKFEPQREHGSKIFGDGQAPPGYATGKGF